MLLKTQEGGFGLPVMLLKPRQLGWMPMMCMKRRKIAEGGRANAMPPLISHRK
jgi:hypothetical protein